MNMIHGEAWPGVEDSLVVFATQFWKAYVDYIADEMDEKGPEHTQYLEGPRATVIEVAKVFVTRLHPPSPAILAEWDDDDHLKYKDWRDDVFEFMERAIVVSDQNLFDMLVKRAMFSIEMSDWGVVDACLSCLISVADHFAPDPEGTRLLLNVISSRLFERLSSPDPDIPWTIKRTTVKLVANYAVFFQKNSKCLPEVLVFLLHAVETSNAENAKYADAAAKTLHTICLECREWLRDDVDELVRRCANTLLHPSVSSYQKQKILAALATVIGGMASEESKIGPLMTLIEFIERELNLAVEHIKGGRLSDGEALGTSSLECLAAIGKALEEEKSITVDLTAEDSKDASNQGRPESGQGAAAIQQRVLSCFNIVRLLPNQGDAMEAACEIIRSGLEADGPGPFVFPTSVVIEFIEQANLNTPRVEAFLKTACAFVSSHSRRTQTYIPEEMARVCRTVCKIVLELSNPDYDPALAQICIDIFNRLLVRYTQVLNQLPSEELGAVFTFITQCLSTSGPNLKRITAEFLVSLLISGPLILSA